MPRIADYGKIFNLLIISAEDTPKTRRELIDAVTSQYGSPSKKENENEFPGEITALKGRIGTVLSDMEHKGILGKNPDGTYRKTEENLIVIRIQQCEEEIFELVSRAPRTRAEIRDALVQLFGTDTTESVKDDNRLFTYIGQVLKKMTDEGLFIYRDSKYSIAPERTASIKNHTEVLSLKREFITRVHSRGGEFFEYYFLNLLTKYLVRMGKTVTEGYVTGGSDDGGIDGVVKTVDSLGFRELIMVQMKNRNDTMTEKDVRGFYGAVCAKQGSRGIFATTSDFHPMATKLLDSIDNCVGVNGDKIFSMACDTSYGIKRDGDRLIIDGEII